ncbi:MAG: ATP-binding cassette domain-containing protein [Treponemataceae bacterium]
MAKRRTILQARNVRISFWTNNGYVRAVRDVSFDLEKGKTLAIVGESGSGKSVTARAILGILAGNATIDDGEIYYDGKDLLQISEEEFQRIRGSEISMIFQDPLSSLNPIIRVGKQLTEAIIANNRAQRKRAKKAYNDFIKNLSENMILAGEDSATVNEMIKEFSLYIADGAKLESAYDDAHDTIETTISYIDGAKIMLIDRPQAEVAQEVKRIVQYCKRAPNDFLIPSSDERFAKTVEIVADVGKRYKKSAGTDQDKAELKSELDNLRTLLELSLKRYKPKFVAFSYYLKQRGDTNIDINQVEFTDKEAVKVFREEFLNRFLDSVRKAVDYSNVEANKNKRIAIEKIDEALKKLETIDVNTVSEICNELKPYVAKGIDRLELRKMGAAYTFDESIDNAIHIYKKSIEAEKLSGKKKNALIKKHKLPTGTTIEKLGEKIRTVLKKLRASFEYRINENTNMDVNEHAEDIYRFLTSESSKMNYKMKYNLARARSIDLMQEVGISNARQRFMQYPFELSGGMRQRVVIAIALASNPDILICDEPTTALDVTIQAQILELINDLKRERNLSIIFITHDLGVVANMADEIAVMYAGKIMEYGTVDEVFYEPAHPYTWALLASMPDLDTKEKLESIPGVPPNMIFPPEGDAFAQRNKYAMKIDFEEQPPMFEITPTHRAATWLLHPDAPKDIEPPAIITDRIRRMKAKMEEENEQQ